MISKIPIEIVNIEHHGVHIHTTAYVNDIAVRLLIDTGASMTVFHNATIIQNELIAIGSNSISSFGIGSDSFESSIASIKSFRLGQLEIKNYKLAVMDLSAIIAKYASIGNVSFDGLLGGDILKKYNAAIDYKTRILKLRYR